MLELERVAAAHWRGTEQEWLGEWLLRAADGFTGRANSALPLGDPGAPLDAALDYVSGWYRARGLPAMIAVPLPLPGDGSAAGLDAELADRGWAVRPGPAFVMVADLPLAAAGERAPGRRGGRGGRQPGRGMARPVSLPRRRLAAAGHARRADLGHGTRRSSASGPSPGCSRSPGSRSPSGWAGLTAVEVDPARRRAGLGRAITEAACAEAVGRGVRRVFLQVEVGNAGARALYERCRVPLLAPLPLPDGSRVACF